jgi:hypothetical protein
LAAACGYKSRVTTPRILYLVALGLGLLTQLSTRAQAAPRELVVAHEILLEAGDSLAGNLDRFVARVAEVAGFGKNGLRGRAFTRPEAALAYIKAHRVPFAILPAHQYVEARKALRLEVLGRAVGLDGPVLQFPTVTRLPRPFADINLAPGLRVATTEAHDPAWLALMTEGDLDPRRRAMALVEVPSAKAALDALVAKKADLAILNPRIWPEVKPRTESGGDLEWIVTSPKIPPSAFLAVGAFVSAADRKKMAAAVDQICKTTGAEACARMGILYVEAGRGETYEDLITGYGERSPEVRAVSDALPRKR